MERIKIMRPNVKKLIGLIEEEGWEYSDQHFSDRIGLIQYRPPAKSYPRISWYGVQLDDDTYLSFDADERVFVEKVFERRRNRIQVEQESRAFDRLISFLSEHGTKI